MTWSITSYRQGCGQELVACYACPGWSRYDVTATKGTQKRYAALCEACLANVLAGHVAELPAEPAPPEPGHV
jgi:hypothetical protein